MIDEVETDNSLMGLLKRTLFSEPPPVPQNVYLPPPSWEWASYGDRGGIWRSILVEAGKLTPGAENIATAEERASLVELQKQHELFLACLRPGANEAWEQHQGKHERAILAGTPPQLIDVVTQRDFEQRWYCLNDLVTVRHRQIHVAAFSILKPIFSERFAAVAKRVTAHFQKEEDAVKSKEEARGGRYYPSLWVRRLWQTSHEIEQWTKQGESSNGQAPAALIAGAFDL